MDLTSASQIETFEGCLRKGAWKYVARIQAEAGPAAALGTEIDDEQLQPFLRDGRPLDFSRPSGEIAQSILRYLPPAGSCDFGGVGLVQAHFEIPSPTWIDGTHCGLGFQGFTDLWAPNGGIELPEGVPLTVNGRTPPAVVDFKSTGDLKWAKTETDLKSDVQAQTYAFTAMYLTGSPVVDLVWLYMRTKGARQGKRVHLRVYADEVAKQFTSIDERARRIHALKKVVTDPLDLPPTPTHCDAFGGCPYRDRCNLSPGEIVDGAAAKAQRRRGEDPMSEATTGLFARLKAQRDAAAAAAGGAPAPASTTPAPEPAATAAPVGINPPEKALPPAEPVGTAAKKGPGRPPKQLSIAGSEDSPVRVRVTWGCEKISPVAYNTFDVGPFEAEGTVQPGETVPQACGRIYNELAAFAEQARDAKARSFATALGSKS